MKFHCLAVAPNKSCWLLLLATATLLLALVFSSILICSTNSELIQSFRGLRELSWADFNFLPTQNEFISKQTKEENFIELDPFNPEADPKIEIDEESTSSDSLLAAFLSYHAFIHIPKTGGKTMEWLAEKIGVAIGLTYGKKYHINGKVDMRFGIHPRFRHGACSWGHVPPIWLDFNSTSGSTPKPNPNREYFENKTTFCFIRSPFDRMVSEFKYHRAGYDRRLKCNGNGLNRFLQSRLMDYDPDFHPYEYRINEKKFNQDDCHYIPQHFYLQSCDLKIPTHEIDKWLYEKFKIKTVEHVNAKTRCELSASNLDSDTKSMIERIYKEDIILYNKIINN